MFFCVFVESKTRYTNSHIRVFHTCMIPKQLKKINHIKIKLIESGKTNKFDPITRISDDSKRTYTLIGNLHG
jgi:hypothetical protein